MEELCQNQLKNDKTLEYLDKELILDKWESCYHMFPIFQQGNLIKVLFNLSKNKIKSVEIHTDPDGL